MTSNLKTELYQILNQQRTSGNLKARDFAMNSTKLYTVITILSLLLTACATEQPAVQTPPAEVPPAVEQPTSIPPTETPLPTTETPAPIKPQPRAELTRTIEMGDKVTKALINLTISADGSQIASCIVSLEEMQCETNIPNILVMQFDDPIAMDEGAFEELKSKIGDLSGEFSSPGEASGTIHLLIDLGLGGEPIECGTLGWSATGK